jgi:dipeptidyl aminopeptidase
MDETNVDDYLYPVYNPTQNASTITPYPEYINMKYPKVKDLHER